MEYIPTDIPEVVLIQPKVFGDARGFFLETFRANEFTRNCSPLTFVQDNLSGSKRGILRGLHYQVRHSQGKLVLAATGVIYDVAVDIRHASPTFGCWVGAILSSENRHQLWVPPGFAHGFLVLSEWAEVFYKVTDYYAPEFERSIRWNDPDLAVNWPLEGIGEPLLSAKDAGGATFKDAELFE
jgi:dTDP-4-dehydrorhamnose 3,5-epimerase